MIVSMVTLLKLCWWQEEYIDFVRQERFDQHLSLIMQLSYQFFTFVVLIDIPEYSTTSECWILQEAVFLKTWFCFTFLN